VITITSYCRRKTEIYLLFHPLISIQFSVFLIFFVPKQASCNKVISNSSQMEIHLTIKKCLCSTLYWNITKWHILCPTWQLCSKNI